MSTTEALKKEALAMAKKGESGDVLYPPQVSLQILHMQRYELNIIFNITVFYLIRAQVAKILEKIEGALFG